jgi:SAM-dependent methyltransferase
MAKSLKCRLCKSKANWFCEYFNLPVSFYKCTNCHSIFKDRTSYLTPSKEKKRYETHNNVVTDKKYQAFVEPITQAVLEDFNSASVGLDYGCGTGPVAAYVLQNKGYQIVLYDPFFYPDKAYTEQNYDFIICCEVMEHFHEPQKEFKHLRHHLKTGGRLYCKTNLISDHISVDEFKSWYYKNDPTHVFFYSPTALHFLASSLGFESLDFNEKLITFKA